MSWLARSIANSLHLDDEDDISIGGSRLDDAVSPEDELRAVTISTGDQRLADSDDIDCYNYNYGGDGDDRDSENDNNLGRGVKEDLSEFKDTLTRQFWGVASFLAPPPPPPPPPLRQKSGFLQPEMNSDRMGSDNNDDDDLRQKSGFLQPEMNSDRMGSNNNDDDDDDEEEEELQYDERDSGRFRDFSNFSQLEDCSTDTSEDAIGITEEVLAFARNIAHHPETWLDFPLSEEEEFDDFDISDAQYKHALAVEHLAPRLAALRIELCPAHMSEGYFWTVYFVLLHSRLNKHDADLLSSPQIVQARSMWMQELQKKPKGEAYLLGSTFHLKETADLMHENFMHSYEDSYSRYTSDRMSPYDPSTPHGTGDSECEKHPLSEIEYIDKSVIKEDPAHEPQVKEMVVGPSNEIPAQDDDYDDDDDDWLKEDPDLIGYSGSMIIGNEEDVSFSDLENDIDCTVPVKSKTVSSEWSTTTKTS